MTIIENNSYEILIDKLVYQGDGIGKLNEWTCFVPFSVPGDKLKVTVTEKKKTI